MELVFVAITLALAGGAYFLYQHFYGSAAVYRRPMSEWLARYALAGVLEQQEMADILLKRSVALAARMGVLVPLDDLLPTGINACSVVERWQSEVHGDFNLAFLPTTPAQTIGALLVIRQLEPERYAELVGESKVA